MTDEEILKQLGRRIAAIRADKNLTQAELAYKCDIDRPNIARIEAGNINPGYLTLIKLSKALDVSIQEFFAKV